MVDIQHSAILNGLAGHVMAINEEVGFEWSMMQTVKDKSVLTVYG